MSRFISAVLWVLILVMIFSQIKHWLKQKFTQVRENAEAETRKPPPETAWQKFQKHFCLLLMVASGISLIYFLHSYFAGSGLPEARNGAIYSVVVFALSYWWRAGIVK
ncbi:MAG: hypothetical protein Kow0037_06770 [Calditrichia bacterium]